MIISFKLILIDAYFIHEISYKVTEIRTLYRSFFYIALFFLVEIKLN